MRNAFWLVFILVTGCNRAVDLPALHQALFDEIQPVKLSNCEFERLGDRNDGGYVVCANLIPRSQAVYSYGINGTDEWGCTVSARLGAPVHQYDCFNRSRPSCVPAAAPLFHEECVGPKTLTEQDRVFDTVENQLRKNGDAGKRIMMKMDVEGAEWSSLHYNNWECRTDTPPLPSRVFELLLVNKNVGVLDPAAKPVFPNPLDAPNTPQRADCQMPVVPAQ